MKKNRRLLTMLLVVVMLASTNLTAFASSTTNIVYETTNLKPNGNVLITDTGIYINGNYYSQEEFMQLLDTAQEVQTPQTYSAGVLVAGTWFIPGIGEVVITVAGIIIIGGTVIAAGTWIYNAVTDWFTQRAEVSATIPSRLKDGNGNVKVGNFNQKVSGRTAYKEKGGWTIEKDTAGHGGRKWKLKNKSGKRVASLDENGRVLGK